MQTITKIDEIEFVDVLGYLEIYLHLHLYKIIQLSKTTIVFSPMSMYVQSCSQEQNII